jgi:hypothetical protein
MAGPFDFTGQNIETTYQRVLQTDGLVIYDGTGSLVNFDIETGSFATTGSNIFIGNQIVTGSILATEGFTGSLQGTASISITSSYVLGSNVDGPVGLSQAILTIPTNQNNYFNFLVGAANTGYQTTLADSDNSLQYNTFTNHLKLTGSISSTGAVTASYFVGTIDGGTF